MSGEQAPLVNMRMGWAIGETKGKQNVCLQQRHPNRRTILSLESRQRGKRRFLSQEFAAGEKQDTERTSWATKRRLHGKESVSLLGRERESVS